MFFLKKTIRKFVSLLDSPKRPKDLQQLVEKIEQAGPAGANPAFQKKLRQSLLMKHAQMAKGEKNEIAQVAHKKEKASWQFKWSMKPFAYAFALVALVAVVGLIGYPAIPAPKVMGYELKGSIRKISYNAPIKIVFSQMMDHGSVENALHIEPPIKGTFEWSGNSLLFHPEKPFEIGQRFDVTIEKKAKSLFQKNLESEYEEMYEITDAPKVTFAAPQADSIEVPVDGKITVIFDRPMTQLTSLDAGEAQFPKISIDPPLQGRFKWLGTNSVSFIPDHLAYATSYTVTIPAGTPSAEGGMTDKEFRYSFTTSKPALMETLPVDMSLYNGPSTNIKLTFNQPMDLAKAKDFIHLLQFQGGELALKVASADLEMQNGEYQLKHFDASKWKNFDFTVRYATAEDLKPKEDTSANPEVLTFNQEPQPTLEELEKTLIIVPNAPLPYGNSFLVKVDKDFKGREGTYALENDHAVVFKTVGEIKIISTNPSDKTDLGTSTQNIGSIPSNQVQIIFSQPMDLDSLQDKVTFDPPLIDPDTKEVQKPRIENEGNGDIIDIYSNFKPSTNYKVLLKGGFKDQFGQTYTKDFSFGFKTAPRQPSFELLTRTNLSILDVYKPPVAYLKTTNVQTVHFNFKKLSQEEFDQVSAGSGISDSSLKTITGPFTSWDKTINSKFNEEAVTQINFEKELGTQLTSGIYYLDVQSPGVTLSPRFFGKGLTVQRNIFVVTGIGLAVKSSPNELLVWATSLQSGEPLQGVKIKAALNTNPEEVLEGTTDKNGLVSIPLKTIKNSEELYSRNYAITAEKDGDFSLVDDGWSEGIAPWNFNIEYGFQNPHFIYSYTDRPIYRPGDTVYFKGIVRKDVDATYKLPELAKVHVTITDSQSQTVFDRDVVLNKNGTYFGDFTLGAQARTGDYMVQTTLDDGWNTYSNISFKIAEYRKPDYKLALEPDKKDYINGDKAAIKVKGSYFFGAPLSNGRIEWSANTQDYYFFLNPDSDSPYASKWFSFSDEGYLCMWGCKGDTGQVASGKAQLDKDGNYTIVLPLDITKKKLSQMYTFSVTAFDLNNQSVTQRITVPVHAGEYYIGILNSDYVVSQKDPVSFDVVSVDFKGQPVANKQVDVSLYKRNWNTVKKKNVDSDFYYENSYEDVFVEKQTVTTDNKGYAKVSFKSKDGGNFKATAESKDSRGNTVKASTTVYVTSDQFINWGRENNDRIELVPDKLEYKPGDTAHILVKSPYQNVWALVTQERQNILERKLVKITSNSQTLDIPITDKSIPNLFVSVLLVKGDNVDAKLSEPPLGANDERSVASFKMGYVALQVNTSSKKLDLEVTPDKTKYKPGDEVTLHVKAADIGAKPQQAEISIAVVDQSVLSLTESVTADLLQEFYRKKFLGVETGETLTKALSRVNVQVEAGLKGGDGSAPKRRGVFKDTAYWKAVVETDKNGEATVKFKLPDNLTTWEVLAIGVTDDTLVGSKKVDFTVTKDVLLRPVLPRFLITNDVMRGGMIVHNYMDKATTFNGSLEAEGVEIHSVGIFGGQSVAGAKNIDITLQPGEEKKIEWEMKILDAPKAAFHFTVTAKDNAAASDGMDVTLPIHPYSFPEVVATSSVISDNTKHVETVWLPNTVDPQFGELSISVAPTFISSIRKGLEFLQQFPYGCAEQVTSALLPNIALKKIQDLAIFADLKTNPKELDKNINAGLQSLFKFQQGNGGWGIWQSSQTNAYLTAYVTYALHQAKQVGYTVDDKVITRARGFLMDYMKTYPLLAGGSPQVPLLGSVVGFGSPTDTGLNIVPSERKYQANLRAYILYVLSETGNGDMGLTNNLYGFKDDLEIFGKAYLAMTLNTLTKQKDLAESVKTDLNNKIQTLMGEILNQAKETPRGVHFEESYHEYRLFDTDTRTTSLVLQMLGRIQPEHPYLPKILRYLLVENQQNPAGAYSSTQEKSVMLLALMEYLSSSKELEPNFGGTVTVNGAEKINQRYGKDNLGRRDSVSIPVKDLLQNNQDNEITATRDGVGKMYFDMTLRYYLPTEQIKPRDEGIVVTHEYFAVNDKKLEKPLSSIPVGENIKGHMTVIVPEDRYYVMVEDFLPAGLEAIDFNLNTSDQTLQNTQPTEGKGMSSTADWFSYSEVRDDRVMYFADFLPKGVYEIDYFARATTPGIFHDLPTLAQELYFPEVFGRSEGNVFEVKE